MARPNTDPLGRSVYITDRDYAELKTICGCYSENNIRSILENRNLDMREWSLLTVRQLRCITEYFAPRGFPRPPNNCLKTPLICRIFAALWGLDFGLVTMGRYSSDNATSQTPRPGSQSTSSMSMPFPNGADPRHATQLATQMSSSVSKYSSSSSSSTPPNMINWDEVASLFKSTIFQHNNVLATVTTRIGKSSRSVAMSLKGEYLAEAFTRSSELHLCIYNLSKRRALTKQEMSTSPFQISFLNVNWSINQVLRKDFSPEKSSYISLTPIIGTSKLGNIARSVTIVWPSPIPPGMYHNYYQLFIVRAKRPSIDDVLLETYERTLSSLTKKALAPGTFELDVTRQLLLDEAQKQVQITRNEIKCNFLKSSISQSTDDDITSGDTVIQLRDPFSLQRLRHPAKGLNCAHKSAFELSVFLEFARKVGKWQCSLCNQILSQSTLVIAVEILLALSLLKSEPDTIIISEDGTIRELDGEKSHNEQRADKVRDEEFYRADDNTIILSDEEINSYNHGGSSMPICVD